MKRSLLALAFFAVGASASSAFGATFQVAPNGGPDCNTGICDLQTALNTAAGTTEGDILLLAPGHYNAGGGTFSYFPPTASGALELRGDPAGGTIFNGSGNQIMAVDTTLAGSDLLSDIFVSDITFQGGVSGNFGAGLGVNIFDADVSVDRCKFFSNISPSVSQGPGGGGLAGISDSGAGTASISLTNSEFRDNGINSSGGGAILITIGSGEVLVEANHFENNSALSLDEETGGGGGLFVLALLGSVTLDRNIFLNNKASSAGGGFLAESIGGPGSITNNILSGNEVLAGGSQAFDIGGGATLVAGGPLNFANNTLVGNSISGGDGGGVSFSVFGQSGVANIFNNIVYGNTATGGSTCPNDCNDIMVQDDGGGFMTSSFLGSKVVVSNNDYGDIFFQCRLSAAAGASPGRRD